MSDPNQPSVPAGWYPDGQGGQRWWDGSQWTEHTQPGGGQPAAPEQPAAPSAPSGFSGDMPTVVAPNRASGYPAPGAQQQPAQQQPAYGQQAQQPYGAPQQGFGAPAGQPPYGAPGQPPYGMPGGPTDGRSNKRMIAILGGVGGLVVLLVVVVVILAVTGVFGGNGPDAVAKDYVNAYADGNFGKACDLMSKDYQAKALRESKATSCADLQSKTAKSENDAYQQEFGDSYDSIHGDMHWSSTVESVQQTGDSATVKMKLVGTYSGDNSKYLSEFMDGNKTQSDTVTMKMVKEGGEWKVASDSDGSSSSSSSGQ
ncbi:MAG: DUF2510 domain-containing protein [Nocardioidaceae bacterium]|nr:DUF2510 domain-containing protein [Nocardioidaceae bacterium]MCL2612947.1 DUF2510 domain-containing protein [Nocardioidaceae bacterium]